MDIVLALSKEEMVVFDMHASSALSALIASNNVGNLFQGTSKEFKDANMKVLAEQAYGFAYHMMVARDKSQIEK